MKKLETLFKNENINTINHNKKLIHIKEDDTSNNVEEELNYIFNGISHPFNTKVIIKTKNKTIETYLVHKTKKSITTLDNEVIPIDEIIYLTRKKD